MNINLMNRNDSINNKIKEFEKVNNKRTISFIDTINNNPESFDYAGGIDEENLKNGFGILKLNDGSCFKGMFIHGHANGFGIFSHSKGDIYKGEFHNDEINGYGEYHYEKMTINSGYWVNSALLGIGFEKWEDSYYWGCFLNGQKNGIGTYIWNNKSKYEGEWKNDQLNGYGIYYFSDGRQYIGEWKDSYMNGFGIYKWNNKKKYFGFFKKGLKNGFGIFYLLNDKYVIGFWKQGMQNGFVKYINKDNIKYGFYKNGCREKWYDNDNEFLFDFIKFDVDKKYKIFFDMDKEKLENYLIYNDV